jgi:hypothetical protein
MMKNLRAVSVLFVAAILVFGASVGQASAGGFYGWGSAGCCGGDGYGGCGSGGCGAWGYGGGYGYGGCGFGGCRESVAARGAYPGVTDYAPYIIGHGPMFPAGDNAVGFSYTTPPTLDMSATSTPSTTPTHK